VRLAAARECDIQSHQTNGQRSVPKGRTQARPAGRWWLRLLVSSSPSSLVAVVVRQKLTC
jgi:hypothetical protein